MGIMVYSLRWVMQDLYHQPYVPIQVPIQGQCAQLVYIWPQSTQKGITVRPKYILFGHMDPEGVTEVALRI